MCIRRLCLLAAVALAAGMGAAPVHATPSCTDIGAARQGTLTIGETHCIRFTGYVGDEIVVTVKRTGGSAGAIYADLYNPDEMLVNPMQLLSFESRDLAYCTAIRRGTYTLAVGASNGTVGVHSASFEVSIDTTTSVANRGLELPVFDVEPVDAAFSTGIWALNAGLCNHF